MELYVWGIGSFYRSNEAQLNKLNITGYIDNKLAAKQTTYKGKLVVSSKNITRDMKVIIMVKEFVPLVNELLIKGITSFEIGVYSFPESYQEQLLARNGKYGIINQKLVYMTEAHTYQIEEQNDIYDIYKDMIQRERLIDHFNRLPEIPFCREFGISRGTPIDRYYIEQFLEKHKTDIRGDVLEIAENTYTMKYGQNRVSHSYILHVKGWGDNVIQGNLETGEGIEREKYDSAVLTQTLMFIFDLQKAVSNIYMMLKPGGVALITVAGISQISRYDQENWGSYWSFYKDSIRKLFETRFSIDNIIIEQFGNVKAATAMLYGICTDEVSDKIFKYNDPQYPVIFGIRVKKDK